jgi:hypothetical protein
MSAVGSELADLTSHAAASLAEDDLVLRCLCNISANRALAEWTAIDQLSEACAGVPVELLNSLNMAGITELPEVQDGDLAETFLSWCGKDGRLVGQRLFERPITSQAANVALERARDLQLARLKRMVRPQQIEDCGVSMPLEERLLFAVILIANRNLKLKLPKDQRGQHNARAAIVPRAAGEPLSEGATRVLLRQFNAIVYSNSGWQITPERVADYLDAIAFKRAARTCLIFRIFKCWNVERLLELQRVLMATNCPATG